jgi:hypothetical protein
MADGGGAAYLLVFFPSAQAIFSIRRVLLNLDLGAASSLVDGHQRIWPGCYELKASDPRYGNRKNRLALYGISSPWKQQTFLAIYKRKTQKINNHILRHFQVKKMAIIEKKSLTP